MILTWKEFKEDVERQGLTDSHEIGWIDFSHYRPVVELGTSRETKKSYANVSGRFETEEEEDANMEAERLQKEK